MLKEVEFLSDKPCWDGERYSLVITQGNDGDYQISVQNRINGQRLGPSVSFSTSGGNSTRYPGCTTGIMYLINAAMGTVKEFEARQKECDDLDKAINAPRLDFEQQ